MRRKIMSKVWAIMNERFMDFIINRRDLKEVKFWTTMSGFFFRKSVRAELFSELYWLAML